MWAEDFCKFSVMEIGFLLLVFRKSCLGFSVDSILQFQNSEKKNPELY